MKGQSAEPAKNLDFGMVFGANPCAMWVYDLDTQQIIDVNEAAAKKYGYTREEMLRLRVTDIRTEEDIPRLFEAIARLRPGASLHTRAHHRKKDGTIVDVGLHVTVFIEAADFRPALVVVQDLDMGESLEQSLRERDNLYRIITEGAGELISLLDSGSKYVYASPAYKVILGYEPVELFGKSAFDIVNAEDLPNFEKAFSQLSSTGLTTTQARCKHANGNWRWIEASHQIIKGKEQNYVLSIGRDVTERVEAEERVRLMIDTALDALISIEEDGTISTWNHQAEETFGWKANEVIGERLADIIIPEPFRAQHWEGLGNFLKTEQGPILNKRIEVPALRKNGEEFPVELTVTASRLHDRWVFNAFVRELTQQKRLEEQLLEARKMESIGRLAGGVAHDFNNLLTAILGYAEVAEASVDDPVRAATYIREIYRAGERAAGLTSQLLAFARKQIIEPRVIDLNNIVRELNHLLSRIIGEHINLISKTSEMPVWTKADHGQIEQVIVNLATNARDAMPSGGKLTIETEVVDLDEEYTQSHPDVRPGKYAMLAVTDTGIGIEESVKGRIFEPFYTTKEIGRGTGLGLATVYGIVKQSGGHIWVYSEPNRGTSFKIFLPLAEEKADTASSAGQFEKLPRGTQTVLVAEDEPTVLELTAVALESKGYVVLKASRAADALKLAEDYSGTIDLLVTDVVMPEMEGDKLARAIRKTRPDMQVLYVSGYTENSIVHGGVLDEGVAFLQKPFSPTQLLAKLAELFAS